MKPSQRIALSKTKYYFFKCVFSKKGSILIIHKYNCSSSTLSLYAMFPVNVVGQEVLLFELLLADPAGVAEMIGMKNRSSPRYYNL